MDIREATGAYERWLQQQLPTLRAGLHLKHRLMAADAFSFLRGTFYRWAQQWPQLCAELSAAPVVLAVGDLHVENFGTWRDAEGRLVWGVNDFDEVAAMPYTQDLARLATSAVLAIEESRLTLSARRACEAVLEGYSEGMRAGGAPAVLGERYRWLRDLAIARLRDQRPFWDHMRALRTVPAAAYPAACRLLRRALPAGSRGVRFVRRQAGVGSLGRARIVALAECGGAMVAREAKPLAPSAWLWARNPRSAAGVRYQTLVRRAVRVPDPFLAVHGSWLLRRLAPDCSRIELSSLPHGHDENRLLWMMGWESANMHLGTPARRRAILADLAQRKRTWLVRASERMAEAVTREWRKWRRFASED